MIGAPSGFEAGFQEFVYYAGPVLQLAYWLTMIVASLWAVTLLKRWVEHQTKQRVEALKPQDSREALAGEGPLRGRPSAGDTAISVDEFVD